MPSATVNAPGKVGVRGGLREAIVGATIALPVVSTVTVKVAGTPVLKTTEAGAWHVAAKGAPVQVKEMVPLKSRPGVSCSAQLADCPAATVAESAVEGLLTENAGGALATMFKT